MSITGTSSIRRLKDVALIMHLYELAPIDGRATGRRDRRRYEWFAEMGQDLANRPWFWCNAISRMSPPQLGHSRGNSSPTRFISFAHAIREVSCERGFWFTLQEPCVACPRAAAAIDTGQSGELEAIIATIVARECVRGERPARTRPLQGARQAPPARRNDERRLRRWPGSCSWAVGQRRCVTL